MSIRHRLLASVFVATLLLGANTAVANEEVGGFIGAVAGGILGNQIGHGAGRVFATGIGATIGWQAGRSLSRSEDYGDYGWPYRPGIYDRAYWPNRPYYVHPYRGSYFRVGGWPPKYYDGDRPFSQRRSFTLHTHSGGAAAQSAPLSDLYRPNTPAVIGVSNMQGYERGSTQSIYITPFGYPVRRN